MEFPLFISYHIKQRRNIRIEYKLIITFMSRLLKVAVESYFKFNKTQAVGLTSNYTYILTHDYILIDYCENNGSEFIFNSILFVYLVGRSRFVCNDITMNPSIIFII